MATGTQRLFLTALLLALAVLQGGCTNLFFYPDSHVYITPDRLDLEYQDVFVDTPEGETLHGWWLPAQGKSKGQVYFLHGNAQNISSHIMNVAWLPGAGYDVFAIDYRGYGRSTGEPSLEGVLHDAESGLRWLVEAHGEEDTPVYLLGQSLGGALALMLASEWNQGEETPELAALILDGTFSGFRTIAREKLSAFWLTWPLQAPLSWTINDDYEGTDHIADISPTPLLIIHSTRDSIIPLHHGTRLYEAAEAPKQFLQTVTPHGATFVVPAYRKAVLEFMADARGN
ncbi:alpha/beta hydrolase [Marinobacter salicampi]|uniref:alpha/beta hydrolase n=1 Tax=Marinobacter salicampi TaxID=435907 RepID=UPI0014078D16|nr:alpha/beta hydrolase [Marinobacter salicampi]